jgi:hypothetical protein
MVTEGFTIENSDSEIATFANLTGFPSLANDNDEFIIACVVYLTDAPPTLCQSLSIVEDMQDMLNDCTQQGIVNANVTRRRASGIDIPQFELEDIVITPTATLNEGGRGARSTLRGARQKERRLSGMCNTIDPNPSLALQLLCCYPGNSYPYCGSRMGTRRRELETTTPISAAEVAQYLPSISEECSSQFQALAGVHPTWFAAVEDVGDRRCHALFLTEG